MVENGSSKNRALNREYRESIEWMLECPASFARDSAERQTQTESKNNNNSNKQTNLIRSSFHRRSSIFGLLFPFFPSWSSPYGQTIYCALIHHRPAFILSPIHLPASLVLIASLVSVCVCLELWTEQWWTAWLRHHHHRRRWFEGMRNPEKEKEE